MQLLLTAESPAEALVSAESHWRLAIELHGGPDYGAPASTVWSSFTPAGRNSA